MWSKPKTGYKVTIVTKDNSLVRELDLADNGMPLKRYKHMQERMNQKKIIAGINIWLIPAWAFNGKPSPSNAQEWLCSRQ